MPHLLLKASLKLPGNKEAYCVSACPWDVGAKVRSIVTTGPHVVLFVNEEPMRCFKDSTLEEEFFSCCWSKMDSDCLSIRDTDECIISAGSCGNIRITFLNDLLYFDDCITWYGHGGAINELRTHPCKFDIFASASADGSVRIWSLSKGGCIAVLGGGLEGHKDQVLSIDWSPDGKNIVSGGVDGRIMIWDLTSLTFDSSNPILITEPLWKTLIYLRLHSGYVDCVRYLPDSSIISKSVDSEILHWSPSFDKTHNNTDRRYTLKGRIQYPRGSLWFTRFTINPLTGLLVWGNDLGVLYTCHPQKEYKVMGKSITFAEGYSKPEEMPLRSFAFINTNAGLSCGQDGHVHTWSIS